MFDWADYISEQYEEYMAENCTCSSSDEECTCMSFEKFSDSHMQDLQEYWAKQACEDVESYEEYQLGLKCNI